MIKQGLMTDAGMELITLAKKTGRWTALEEVQESIIPSDLKKAFEDNNLAEKNFSKFPPSSKRIILE